MKNRFKKFLGKLKQKIKRLFQYQKRDSFPSIVQLTPYYPDTYQKSRTAPLPRVYVVPKLILSVVYGQDDEYVGVDMSQYESQGIAHYFVCRTETSETIMNEYNAKRGYEAISPEDEEITSSMFEDAILIEEVDGLWEWYD